MTAPRPVNDTLRASFQALGAGAVARCSDQEIEQIWQAVTCELPARARRDLVDRLAANPAAAEAWRMAEEIWHQSRSSRPAPWPVPVRRPAFRVAGWWASAAAAVLVAALGLASWVSRPPADDYRAPDEPRIASALPADAAIPRRAFVLRWQPGPAGARYQVTLTTDDLRVLAVARQLASAEFAVDPETLSGLPSGARVLWQVEMATPDGDRISSPTFVARVE